MVEAMEREGSGRAKFPNKVYNRELFRLQEELVKMEQWVADTGARVVAIFEGRDAAGKGGAIKRITEHTNPRITRHVALPRPSTESARNGTSSATSRSSRRPARSSCSTAAGTTARASSGCSGSVPLPSTIASCGRPRSSNGCSSRTASSSSSTGSSVSDEEQERRFENRIDDPLRRWKLSETDLYSRTKWVDYSRAKDEMFVHTDIPEAPWYVVDADNKKKARLNCISHLLSKVPYEPRPVPEIVMPPRQQDEGYVRPPRDLYTYVADHADEVLHAWKQQK